MESHNSIIFFGDLSLPISSAFSQLLHAEREHTLLSKFLGQARATLEAEALKLPISERKDLPNLGNLHSLPASQDGHAMDHPTLSPALLVMLQLGQFIAYVGAPGQLKDGTNFVRYIYEVIMSRTSKSATLKHETTLLLGYVLARFLQRPFPLPGV